MHKSTLWGQLDDGELNPPKATRNWHWLTSGIVTRLEYLAGVEKGS
jgi:hypothetical protein